MLTTWIFTEHFPCKQKKNHLFIQEGDILYLTLVSRVNFCMKEPALTSKYIFNGMIPVSFCIFMPVLLFGSIKAHKLPGIFRYDPVVLPVPGSPPFVLHSYPKRIWKPLSISCVYSFNLSCFHYSSILRCFCSRLCFTFFSPIWIR